MADKEYCDPCNCPEMYMRDEQSWMKAVLKLLCDIIDELDSIIGGTPGV